ncbi:hypothetical protein MPTK1_2g08750 [Marchantia polymorpha subsp. ruderalis]|uniref:Amino acid transporter transmembrane domain-containing protein n=1 Tax=Marchantia polymorpha TaxID=3197 RepID=A0A2R6XH03_MARPO|nr:hypothetical protein MARPO_0015s0160 [Marchantia polymorpha]BBN01605.1 hypothetical protein Mp_2g08750 [Marchantia polymorpha subsp. ruderalis]|eukprot:PTQ45372.1 hypothetical protein MARPO_0015s0160 [Marchantia polymorpha]
MEVCVDLAGNRRRFGKNESPWVSVFNLCNAAIGAGVLSFPYGFRRTGIVGGLFFTGIIWVIEVFALCLLVRVTEKYSSQSYQQLVFSVLGSKMAVITSVTMITFLVGSMISYLMITGDVFAPVFAELFGETSAFADRRVVILLFTIMLILPHALKTTFMALYFSSVISVAMLIYLTVVLVTIGAKGLIANGFPSDILMWESGRRAFIIIDIVVFAFQCHIQVVPIFAELAEHPSPFFGDEKGLLEERLLDEEVIAHISSRQRSERVKRMDGVIFTSMSLCVVCYCLVGLFGYLIFPDVESDVLKSFGDNNGFLKFARIGMAVVAMVCYPVQSHPARSILDDFVKAFMKAPVAAFSVVRQTLLTLLLAGCTLTVALLTNDVGTVFSVLASSGGVMVVFIIPGLLLVRGIHSAPVGYTDHTLVAVEGYTRRTRTTTQKFVQIVGGTLMLALGSLTYIATCYVAATGMESDSD